MKPVTMMKKEPSAQPGNETGNHVPGNENRQQKKSSAWGVGAGVVLGVLTVGAVALYLNMGSMSKSLTERVASQTLGVPVTLARMDVDLPGKTAAVSSLTVANPAGFKGASSFTADKITIVAESLSPALVVFKTIEISGAAVNLEVTETTTNLSAIRNQVDSRAAEKPAGGGQKAPPRVVIRDLLFNGVKLNPVSTPLGGDMMPVELAALRITGIGEQQNGVLASAAIAQVLEQVTKTALQSGIQAGYMQGMAPEALSGLKSQMGIVATFREQAREGLENLKSSIRNLFHGGESNAPPPAAAPQQP